MNILDVIVFVLIALATYGGFKSGFIMEVSTFIGLIVGLYAATQLSGLLAEYLKDHVNSSIVGVVSFFIIFLTILLLTVIVAKIVTGLAEVFALGIINRIFGGLLGAIKALFIISLLLALLAHFSPNNYLLSDEMKSTSVTYKTLKSIYDVTFPFLHLDEMKNEISTKIAV